MISREMGDRTENAVKNRFELLGKRIINRAKKEAYQQSIKTYMARYIKELELDELANTQHQLLSLESPPPLVQ